MRCLVSIFLLWFAGWTGILLGQDAPQSSSAGAQQGAAQQEPATGTNTQQTAVKGAGQQGAPAVAPPVVAPAPAAAVPGLSCHNPAPADKKTDNGSQGMAIEAIARLQQCQVANWRVRSSADHTEDAKRINACIKRTLGNGSYYWLRVVDLPASELTGNAAVGELHDCIYGQLPANQVAAQDKVAADLSGLDAANKRLLMPLPTVHTNRYRIIGGISAAAASGTDPVSQFLGVASAQFPLASYQDLTAPVWLWGDLRVGSIAQPGTLSSIQSSSGISSYITPASSSPNQIVQSIEFHAGLDKTIWMWGKNQTPNTISAVGTGGIITPLSTSQWTPTYFVATNDVQTGLENDPNSQYGSKDDLTAKFQTACNTKDSSGNLTPRTCYVAFPPKDRTTLYHDYGIGGRLKWYWYDGVTNKYLYPSIVDVILGQSEYVTGGKFHGTVLHFGGSSPIPQYPQVYIFGSFDTRITGKSASGSPLLLVQATGTGIPTALTNDTVVPIQVGQQDRDRWQIGIGFDLKTIVDHWSAKK